MQNTWTHRAAGKHLMCGLAAVGAVCGLAGVSAQAGLPDPFELHERLRDQAVRDLRTLAEVPRVILADHRAALNPYAVRAQWDRRHRHYYSSYRFPVLVNGVRAYRDFDYCDDRLVLSASFGLPRFAVDIAVPGIFFDGVVYVDRPRHSYAPARGYACDRSYAVRRDRRDCGDDDRRGWRGQRGRWHARGHREHDRDDDDD